MPCLDQYDELREDYYESLQDRTLVSLTDAIANQPVINFEARPPVVPKRIGVMEERGVPIADIVPYIDWNPFFQIWELRGEYRTRGYPRIFEDAKVGAEARKVFDEGQAMLKKIIDEGWLEARGVCGIFPANRVGEDVAVYTAPEGGVTAPVDKSEPAGRFCMLRQQTEVDGETSYRSLADFIAPEESGMTDYIGAFAVGIFGGEEQYARFAADMDDYSKIMLQVLSDRLAEAYAEKLHHEMRRDAWGYAPDEALDAQELHKIKYQGIRPAPGYPSQPDHTEKRTMWSLLGVKERIGLELTSGLAMMPASAVSALVFAHPDSEYFAVGKIGKDQVEAYAARKGMELSETERWLQPVLSYEPSL